MGLLNICYNVNFLSELTHSVQFAHHFYETLKNYMSYIMQNNVTYVLFCTKSSKLIENCKKHNSWLHYDHEKNQVCWAKYHMDNQVKQFKSIRALAYIAVNSGWPEPVMNEPQIVACFNMLSVDVPEQWTVHISAAWKVLDTSTSDANFLICFAYLFSWFRNLLKRNYMWKDKTTFTDIFQS